MAELFDNWQGCVVVPDAATVVELIDLLPADIGADGYVYQALEYFFMVDKGSFDHCLSVGGSDVSDTNYGIQLESDQISLPGLFPRRLCKPGQRIWFYSSAASLRVGVTINAIFPPI